jgi:hypothetical protein
LQTFGWRCIGHSRILPLFVEGRPLRDTSVHAREHRHAKPFVEGCSTIVKTTINY